ILITKPILTDSIGHKNKCEISLKNKLLNISEARSEKVESRILTMYQNYIYKKYELRIFYLKGQFYSMAIFSQQNEKTKIDFSNYDRNRPNRFVPYKLPQKVEKKLHKFMRSINMNCGSIDMIYTPKGEYVFLEVNP